MTGIWKRSGKRDDPSPRGLPAGQAGFTLIEVMVALSILAITFVVILGLQNRDILQHQEARYLTRATLLAQQKISEVEMAGFPALGILNGGFPEPDEIFDWTETVSSTPFEYAREVRVEVGWKEGSRRDSVTLITFVMEEKP
ncbi:MAG: prepilin-type N-terminal cleavage/methylation domain-containing protein [Nitrospirae bacterium]|nr:prepilin-type N-terminal cleavage/methylation domain-containing protein [Nitrospirota bacterium]